MPELSHETELDTAAWTKHKKPQPLGSLWWLPVWAITFCMAVALYWPALHAGYFSDDFLFFATDPPEHLYDYFFRVGAAIHAYRPLEAIILTVTQQHLRFETLPIHLLALACHAGLVCVVLAAARAFRFGTAETVIAGALMLFAQVSAPAVLGNDTLSQSASAFLGALSAFLFWRQQRAGLLSVLSLGAGLFFKETALGFLLVIGILAAYVILQQTDWRERARKATYLLLPYALVTLLYFAGRHLAGGMMATHGRYGMHVGLNVLRNLVSFGLAAFSPVSTVTSAIALATHHKTVLLLSLVSAGIILAVTAAGVLRTKRRMLCCSLAVLAVASLFPTFLLDHVSELYAYNAVPFVALIIGVGFGAIWRWNNLGRATAGVILALFLTGQTVASRQKAELMTLNGNRAAQMISTIDSYVRQLPPHSQVDLIRAATNAPAYSVFVLNGFDVLDYGNIKLGAVLGRPDVKIDIVEENQARGLTPNDHLLLLGLDKNSSIERYAPGKP
jgi:hypothetical protein